MNMREMSEVIEDLAQRVDLLEQGRGLSHQAIDTLRAQLEESYSRLDDRIDAIVG